MKHWPYIALIAALLLIGAFMYFTDSPAGAVTSETAEGTTCCTFIFSGEEKTCAAPAGQTCQVCRDVCGAQ